MKTYHLLTYELISSHKDILQHQARHLDHSLQQHIDIYKDVWMKDTFLYRTECTKLSCLNVWEKEVPFDQTIWRYKN